MNEINIIHQEKPRVLASDNEASDNVNNHDNCQ